MIRVIKERHKIAFREVMKGATMKDAMLKAGYSPSVSLRSNKIKNSLGWKALMEKYLPDDELARVHQEGLKATQYISRGIGKGYTELVEVEDHSVRHKYLQSAYAIKGKSKEFDAVNGSIGAALIQIIMPNPPTDLPKPVEYQDLEPNNEKLTT